MILSIILSILILIMIIPILLLLINVRKRLSEVENTKTEFGTLAQKIAQSDTEIKNEVKSNQTALNTTLTQQIQSATETLVKTLGTIGNSQRETLESVTKETRALRDSNQTHMDNVVRTLEERFTTLQTSNEQKLAENSKAVTNQLQKTSQSLVTTIGQLEKGLQTQLNSGTEAINTLTQSNQTLLEHVNKTIDERITALQTSNEQKLVEMGKSVTNELQKTSQTLTNTVQTQLNSGTEAINTLTQSVDNKLKALQTSNEQKLDQINETVNQKLQSTLTQRLQEAFKQVSDRLESVQKGLGQMQVLAKDVGSLQRVLSDVRERGAWGEVTLNTILEEILIPEQQYGTQVKIHDGEERVDFAIRLPANSDKPNRPLWLPIDSKFPISAYQELAEATKQADKEAEQAAIRRLLRAVRDSAKSIKEKYIKPPYTTEFAIMFLPTEGLYAEVVRHPSDVDQLLRDHRIVVAGPTTIASILLSIRVGFQTLAIQQHSTQLWDILAKIKTEFSVFDEAIRVLKTHLNNASNKVDEITTSRQEIDKTLISVERKAPQLTDTEQNNDEGEYND